MDEARKCSIGRQLNPLLAQVDLYEIRVANALWGEKTYPFSPAYLETVHKFYNTGGAFPVDFRQNPEGERQTINAWVEEPTNKRSATLMPQAASTPHATGPDQRDLFQGPVDRTIRGRSATKEEDFPSGGRRQGPRADDAQGLPPSCAARYAAFNADGSFFATPHEVPAQVDSPIRRRSIPCGGGFVLARYCPTRADDLSMLVILPQDHQRPGRNWRRNSPEKRPQPWTSKPRGRPVHVFLPKFKLETGYQMKETAHRDGHDPRLRRSVAGPPGAAQFDGMCTSTDLEHKLYIGQGDSQAPSSR